MFAEKVPDYFPAGGGFSPSTWPVDSVIETNFPTFSGVLRGLIMKREKLDDVLVIVGGIIPDQDIPKLKELGVSEVFQPGVSTEDIIDYVRRNIGKRRHSGQS